ncbi:hypothetical protein K491DRAFT_663791 [Lophiostoma macrostomum CBS 122681]|uniref:Protein transport protein sec16 n=1 Tax=Lophiostoma macrostomum CBS 122681 TaxID=1314788 RepID=A0A6A6SZF9_9PLEO|nr:hypothetical protein K491DRAFT_663791 [Lophiostoma macrostomum CBS 122681]
MDHDDGPNFAYAYGGTSVAGASSWNPALRPDHEEEQPATGIAKSAESPPESPLPAQEAPEAVEDDEDDLPTAPSAAPAIPAHVTQTAFDREPNSDDDFFDRYGSGDFAQSVPHAPAHEIHENGVSGADDEALVNGMQTLNVEEAASDEEIADANGVNDASDDDIRSQEQVSPGSEAYEEHQAEVYEHQGETTLLEEAVIESAQEPLLGDSEATNDDWDAPGEVFDLGGKPQDAPLLEAQEPPMQTPHAEAVGTTVGDQVIGNTRVGGNTGEDIDWGNGDDQDFFANATSQKAPSNDITASGTDPMWDLSLDDDFLPENDDTAAPFELDDDDGFLEDEPSQPVQELAQTARVSSSGVNRYAPQVAQTPQPAARPYGAQAPQFTDFSQTGQNKPVGTPNIAYGGYGQPVAYQQQPSRPAMPSSADSFAAKAKGGYHSPYDLPEDIVTTRRRPAARAQSSQVVQPAPPPPPRSSSMYPNPAGSAPLPPPPSNVSASSLSPPSSSQSNQSPMTGLPAAARPAPSTAPSSDFFAELPVASKPKPPGRYAPQQNSPQQPQAPHTPPQHLQKERTSSWSSLRNEILPDDATSQFRQPERLPVFPEQPSVPVRSNSLPPPPAPAPVPSRYSPQPPSAAPSGPVPNARYSPAPPAPPAANARYSPAPPPVQRPVQHRHITEPPVRPPQPPVHSYIPRNSSPLAYHSKPQEPEPAAGLEQTSQAPTHLGSATHAPFRTSLEGVNETEEQGQSTTTRSETPPPPRSNPSSTVGSPRKRPNYIPQPQTATQSSTSGLPPLARSQTQSPESTMKHPPLRHALPERRESAPAYSLTSPISAHGVPTQTASNLNIIPHKRQMSHDFACIPPVDERASDQLERWKGYPIFKWGLGGTVVTSFPKQIPRYGGGASQPMMKCSPGEVKIQNIKEAVPLADEAARFPGPLKAKSKKKEVSAWLGTRIVSLESQLKDPGFEHSMNSDALKRFEEKLLLWKLLQVLVDNDGQLEGNAIAEAAVRKILSPEGVDPSSDAEGAFSTAADLVGRSRSNTATMQSDPIDPKSVEELRSLLTKGDREKAVWHAVDRRLWAHAMLLSSTLNKDTWKQVVQEFVKKEVKKMGSNNQALAALYEVFAGNWEDCIDELVPASARAGFQMVSTDGAGSAQDALQGLDKWRETLSLVLSNRSIGDAAALLSLGRLLAGYGRVEAAHICFIFARPTAYIGGADDSQSDIVLVGADHRSDPSGLGHDIEPILLTEVYEFALSLSAQGGSHIVPHLQNYKLAHAYTLAEYGYRSEAQAYCDAIAAAMKSTTKISPYYNASFIASLDDLSKRLSQSPKDGSSWISKPSMDKVSSSLLSKFNSFIAGDEDDAASNHSGGADVGPFAKIAGNTPTISPSPSSGDLYGAYSGYGIPGAPVPAQNSRYAPSNNSNTYAPRTSSDLARSPYEPQGRPSMDPPGQPRPEINKASTYSPLKAPATSAISYGSPYQPTPPAEDTQTNFGAYQSSQPSFNEQPPSPPAEQTRSSSGYEPPSMGGYEPPSYQPYQPDEEEQSPVEVRKKKSFMDDDEDDSVSTRAAALKSSQKSDTDRKADEAFRAAAEADAARDKEGKKAGGGWFGGWFKKDPNATPGPIKAKLGEESSFYYDPELKKWVNKKAGAAEPTRPMATPPPPKSGPPSRTVSGSSVAANHAMSMGMSAMGPPSSLPNGSPLTAPPTSNPMFAQAQAPRSSSMPPPMMAPGSRASTPGIPSDGEGGSKPPVLMPPGLAAGSGPPSRPGTGMSNASSIEDLIGAPSAKRGTVKKKRGGRYVDVMAQK